MAHEESIIPPCILPPCGNLTSKPAHRLLIRFSKRSTTCRLLHFFQALTPGILLIPLFFFITSLHLEAQQEALSLGWPLISADKIHTVSETAYTAFGTGKAVEKVIFGPEFGVSSGGWNSAGLNPAAFYEYRVAPNEGTSLSIDRLKVDISLGYGSMHMAALYSTDRFRSEGLPIGQPMLFYTTTPETLSLPAGITISYPDTLSIRIYAWGASDRYVEFNNRNFRVEGVAAISNVMTASENTPLLATDTIDGQEELLRANVISDQNQKDIPTENGNMSPLAIVPPFTTPGAFTWVCPAGVTCIKVECWAGGGRGGDRTTSGAAGGGGGGAYSRISTYTVIPSTTYYGNVGNGGNSTSPGGDSWFGTTNQVLSAVVLAKGGNSVPDNSAFGVAGGASLNGIGDVKYDGGTGGNVITGNSGGGGGGAGSTGPGGNASGITAGTGTPLYGGNGGTGLTANGNGNAGSVFGGGGGGERRGNPTNYTPGAGASGQVIITYISSFNITPFNGIYCFGASVAIGLSGSETGVTYQLYRNVTPVGSPVTGTGSAISFGNQTVVGTYTVVATLNSSSCTLTMNGTVVINPLQTITLISAPGTDNQTVCVNNPIQNIVYQIGGGATGATLTGLPANFTGTLVGNTFTISGIPPLPIIYNYTVTTSPVNGCEVTATGTINSIIGVPAQPSVITGPTSPCAGTSQTYSVTNVTGVTYTWVVPAGWIITAGQGTNVIIVTVGATGGNIVVTPSNPCGNGPQSSLAVNPANVPAQPSAIIGNTNPCQGSTQTYSVTNITGVTYNWSVPAGWAITGGQGTNSITVTVGAAGGTITVTPSNACGNGTQQTLNVTVSPLPGSPTSITAPASVCVNAGGTITLTVNGGSGTNVRWFTGSCGGVEIGFGPSTSLTISSPIVTTTYYARWESACGISGCASVTVNVIPLPAPPSSATVDRNNFCADDPGQILLTAVGGSGTTLKWFTGSCGGTEIGAVNPLTINSPTVTTTYYARWENSCGVSTCTEVTVTVKPLVNAPTSATVDRQGFCYSDAGDITLTAIGGSGNTLEWFTGSCGGTPLGTGTPLVIPSPAITTTYYVRWSNDCGTSGCVNVMVTVNVVSAGTIATDQTICYGGDPALITSTTDGTGLGTIYYRWEFSVSPYTVWTVIPIETGATYNPPAGLTVTTKYRRITISDYNNELCESPQTTPVTVTVQSQAAAGSIGYDQSVCFNGDPDPFVNLVSGTGSGTITYRWEKAVAPFTVWTTIPAATGPTYDPGILLITTSFRRITVSTLNGVVCESDPSNTVTVFVQDNVVTTGMIGYNQTICYGSIPNDLVSLIDGTGSGTITYEWQSQVNPGPWTTITGATDPGLIISTPLFQTTQYRRRTIATLAGNSCYSPWTVAVIITVMNPVTSGSIAASQTICNGSVPAPITSTQNGSSPGSTISYIWQNSIDGGGTWIVISAANLPGYSPPALTQTTWYRRITVATSTDGHQCLSVPTNVVIITVQVVVNPGSIAADQAICYGGTPAPLTSVAPGSGSAPTVTYSWEYSINNGITWIPIPSATGDGYAPGALTQTTWYRRITTSTLNSVPCSAASTPVIITVNLQVTASVVSANQTICYNTAPAQLTRTNASGGSGSFTYQWQSSPDNINFTDITGQTGLTYQPPVLTSTTYYRVKIVDAVCGIIYSNVVKITVWAQLVEPTICCDQVVCQGYSADAITIVIPPSGGSGIYTYQWEWSNVAGPPWTPIVGATFPSYTPTVYDRYYRVVVTDASCGTVYSLPVHIISSLALALSFTGSGYPSSPVCPGYSFTYHITSIGITWSGKYIKYSWTADPAYVSPPTGGPVGEVGNFLFIYWYWADIPYTVYNNTGATVTTTIYVTPVVYNSNGSVYCNLTPQSFNVTIYPFKIQCPADIGPVSNIINQCYASVTTPNPAFIGSCGATKITWALTGATVGNSPASGLNYVGTKNFNVGVTTVTYTATNTYNVSTTCSFNVTVADTQVPAITCPGNITLPVLSGCSRIVTYTAPVISDNCPGSTITQISGLPSGSDFPIGTTTNTFKVTDAAGNSATCSFTVTITDPTPPTITNCPGNQVISTDLNSCTRFYDPPDPTVNDNCPGFTLTWVMTGATTGNSPATGINYIGNTEFTIGVTTITYTATDSGGNTTTCTFTVTVKDTEDPLFTFCPFGYSVANTPGNCSAQVATQNPEISDNCGINSLTWTMSGSTAGSSPLTGLNYVGTQTFNVGVTTVTYVLTDNNGNNAICSFDVTVSDTEPPQLTCPVNPQNRPVNTGLCIYTASGSEFDPVTATDNCSFTLANNLNGGTTLAGYIFPVGTTNVIWIITDPANNAVNCNFNVIVVETIAPVLVGLPTGGDLGCNPSSLPACDPSVTATDNCDINVVVTCTPGVINVAGCNRSQIFTYTAVDDCGNIATGQVTYTWKQDTVLPVISTTASSGNLGCNPGTITAPTFTGLDNCDGIFTPNVNIIGPTNNGCAYTQTWTATFTDACGNVAVPVNITYTWTIDTGNPIITTTAISGDLGCNPIVVAPVFTGTDNCEGNIIPIVTTAGPTINGCSYSQTWTANYTDACGNIATPVSITYTWTQDTQAPAITCPANQVVVVNNGNYIHGDNTWDATAIDNCGLVSLSAMLSGATNSGPFITLNGVTFNQGITIVTWTAIDICGNSASCIFSVTVQLGTADISVDKSGPLSVIAGQNITYTIIVTNNGAAVAPLVTLTDAMPSQILATPPVTYTLNTVPMGSWPGSINLVNIPVGPSGVQTITITGKVDCNAVDFSNMATVALAPPLTDPDLSNNTSTWSVSIINPLTINGTVTNTSCPGYNDGSIDITVSGGTSPYSFSWSTSDGIIPTGQEDDEDLTGLVAGTYTIVVTDANGCEATQSFLVESEPDTQGPTFAAPAPVEFCVSSIMTAFWDGQPEPLADIIPARPDWYVLDGTPELDISNISDNCCPVNQCTIYWTITFNDELPHPPVSGTGQPSAYGPLTLWGNTDFTEAIHTITYVVVDCNNIPSAPVSVPITIKPRPNVIKQ